MVIANPAFASEAKNLIGLCKKIYPFPIGSYYCNGKFVRYCDIADTPAYNTDDMDTTLTKIREKLVAGVDKRLDADTPVGFLLSGVLHCRQEAGQAHPHLCHWHERGRH